MAKIEAAGSDKTAKAEKNKQLACVFCEAAVEYPSDLIFSVLFGAR
jgi:hypothetical protein